ncbi:MAG: hypothetical protein JWP12_3096 [Bacteroidetes bacterium]|nr:hypothetical protein [Bacteroidota bacterium]
MLCDVVILYNFNLLNFYDHMAKKDKHQHQHKPQQKAQTIKTVSAEEGIFVKLDTWFEKHSTKLFYILLLLSTLFSLLLFDSKVSEGGDDSSYIQRAWSLLHEHTFPYFQGPAYPVFLSVFVKMFGLNVIALKFFSVICQIGFVWFTYKTFVKRIPYTVLFALISFISFNAFIQYYASQTFTETFFLFVQSICLYVTFNIIDSIDADAGWIDGIKKDYKKWLLFGFMFMLLTISKSIAFVTIAGVLLYFVLKKNYKQVVYAIVFFLIMRIIYQLLTTAIYGANDSNQLEMMLRKDLYKPELGHEGFGGMIDRFFTNFYTYMSMQMYRILNIRNVENDAKYILPGLSYITAIIMGVFTFLSYKKNKYVFFSCLYMLVLCGGVFFGVQANNMQDRLIIIAMPLIFLVLFYGAYELAKRSGILQFLVLAFAAVMLLVTIGKSSIIAEKNITALKKNLNGDVYYGYTPDWVNFLKMSKYCADSLPDSAQVLSRKPNMSFIYGNGKKFAGQYWVTTTNADSIKMEWQTKKIQYILLPNLRMIPGKNNGRIVNTIHRMLGPYAEKYPQNVKLVKTIGTIEKCELYEITYGPATIPLK